MTDFLNLQIFFKNFCKYLAASTTNDALARIMLIRHAPPRETSLVPLRNRQNAPHVCFSGCFSVLLAKNGLRNRWSAMPVCFSYTVTANICRYAEFSPCETDETAPTSVSAGVSVCYWQKMACETDGALCLSVSHSTEERA